MRQILSLLLALLVTTHAQAGRFDNVGYGGRLAQPDGEAIQGPVNLDILLYRTPTGNTLLETKNFANVKLDDGVFEVNLGDIRSFLDGDVWVEVKDVTNNETYPRQKFTPVPFALRIPVKSSGGLAWDNGELKVNFPATNATAIGSRPVSINSTPTNGQVLTYNSGNWVAETPTAEASADVTDAVNVAAAGAVMDGDFTTNGIMTRTAEGVYSVFTDDSAKWNTAHGWGDHSMVGYLTSSSWLAPGAIGVGTPDTGSFTSLSADTFTSTGIDDNATSTAITITPVGKVGIGTISPTHKLEVNGNIVSASGIAVGSFTPKTVIFGYSANASNSCVINAKHGLDSTSASSATISGTECQVTVTSLGLTSETPVCTCSVGSRPDAFCNITTDFAGSPQIIKTQAFDASGTAIYGWHQVVCIATKI